MQLLAQLGPQKSPLWRGTALSKHSASTQQARHVESVDKALKGSCEGTCVILVDIIWYPHEAAQLQISSLSTGFRINTHHQTDASQVATCLAFVEARTMTLTVWVFIEDLNLGPIAPINCINCEGTATMAVESKSLKLLLKSCCLPAAWACRFVSWLVYFSSHGRVAIWPYLGVFCLVIWQFLLPLSQWFHSCLRFILSQLVQSTLLILIGSGPWSRYDSWWSQMDSSCQFWRCQLEVWLHAHACGCGARNSHLDHLDDLEFSSRSSFRAKLPSMFRSCSATEIRCRSSGQRMSKISVQPGLADFQHKCRDSHHLGSSHKGRGAGHSDTAGHAGSWGALVNFTCTPSFMDFTVCQSSSTPKAWMHMNFVLYRFRLGCLWTWFWMVLNGGVYGKCRRIRRTNSTTMMACREKCCLWSWQVDTSAPKQPGCQIHPDTLSL